MLYPDFYKDNYILDAKYKHLNSGVGREDLYQVITYMFCTKAKMVCTFIRIKLIQNRKHID